MERVAIYLRKSRQDIEAETRGEGETLAKHKTALLKLAKQQGLNIVRIFEEIASGESLIHRPQMLALLKAVESDEYDGVLVMDMDRLGRGNMREQGLILETFQESKTKIITPRKTYDLSDEFDEEYSEFETFMARRELKLITRRLQRGRIASVREGRYLGTRPPYGYELAEIGGHRTLIPHPDQATIVRMIYDWYTDPTKSMGANNIANELNTMNIPSYSGQQWDGSVVRNVLKNPVYTGKIKWRQKERKKSTDPSKITESRTRPKSEWIIVEGKHEPLVDEMIFAQAQSILSSRTHTPVKPKQTLANPLAGLIRCELCGFSMVLRPYVQQKPHIICQNRLCPNKSARFDFVEQKLLDALQEWLTEYKAQWGKRRRREPASEAVELRKAALQSLLRELAELEKQKERLHDFLERGVYDEATYLDRSQNLANRIEETRHGIANAEAALGDEIKRAKAQLDIIPSVENALKLYHRTEDQKKKNALLKSVVECAMYYKEKHQKGDNFKLVIYPKLPPSTDIKQT